jgi:Fe-Mn family superoxide dismutase
VLLLPNGQPRELSLDLPYRPRYFDLSGLSGISDRTLEAHFRVYEDYVKATNALNESIAELANSDRVDGDNFKAFSALQRRLGFEFNGMVLHEYYFDNLQRHGTGQPGGASAFRRACEESFGSYQAWRDHFAQLGATRGGGWAVAYLDSASGQLSNAWIPLNKVSHASNLKAVLVMDVWDHAFHLDYGPAQQAAYVESFFANVDWSAVEGRVWPRAAMASAVDPAKQRP